jgi:hypothetical protein
MKQKKNDKDDKAKTTLPDRDSVKKLLKKKELQTDILKKIIKNNKLSDNKSL